MSRGCTIALVSLTLKGVAGKEGEKPSKKRKRGQADSVAGLHLSLRPSHGAWRKAATSAPAGATSAPETLDVDRLKKGQQVRRGSNAAVHCVVAYPQLLLAPMCSSVLLVWGGTAAIVPLSWHST